MIITKIEVVIPSILLSQPINPWSRRGTMEFEKKFLEKALIFC